MCNAHLSSVAILFIAAPLFSFSALAEPLLHPNDRVVFVGDSITGQSINHPQGYLHQLKWALNEVKSNAAPNLVALGGSGQSVGSWMNVEQRSRTAETFLDITGVDVKATLDAGADVLIIMLGMNDLLAPYVTERTEDLDAWAGRYRTLLRSLRDRAKPRVTALATITLLTEDPVSPKNRVRGELNRRVAEIAASEKCVLIQTGDEMLGLLQRGRALKPDFHVTGDFCHPNALGHTAVAMAMMKGLGETEVANKLASRYLTDLAPTAKPQERAQPSPISTSCWRVAAGIPNQAAWPGNVFNPTNSVLPFEAALLRGEGFDQPLTHKGKAIPWTLYAASVNYAGGADPASIDPYGIVFGYTFDALYAVRWIYSEKKRAIDVVLGSKIFAGTLGMTVWMNGAQVYAKALTAEPKKTATVPTTLRKGWNTLLVKCDHLTWQWQFSCALSGRDGDTLSDLRYSAEPQR